MSDKSQVGMGFLVCPITGEEHSESILLDKEMKPRINQRNFLGYEYCPEVKAKISEGYVCFIEVKNQDDQNDNKRLSLKEADRTGVYCFVKKELAKDMFNVEGEVEEVQFVSPEVTEFLSNLKEKIKKENGDPSEESKV